MKLFIVMLSTLAQTSVATAQAPPQPPPFSYPNSEKLRTEGYEIQSVLTSMGGAALALKKGNVLYICDLKPYTFNATGEQFFIGEKCQRVL